MQRFLVFIAVHAYYLDEYIKPDDCLSTFQGDFFTIGKAKLFADEFAKNAGIGHSDDGVYYRS
jgi:hypothetical protein